jgi:transposase
VLDLGAGHRIDPEPAEQRRGVQRGGLRPQLPARRRACLPGTVRRDDRGRGRLHTGVVHRLIGHGGVRSQERVLRRPELSPGRAAAAHLVSWAGLCPSARQSGPRTRTGKKGHGDTWLRSALGQAANGAARTPTFLGERYDRILRRRGKAKAQVARSILIIIWHLLADPAAQYTDLGTGHYQARTDTDRKIRNHIRQIQALGFDVTITNAA